MNAILNASTPAMRRILDQYGEDDSAMSTATPPRAYRAAYRAQQATFLYNCLAAHSLLRAISGFRIQPSSSAVREVRKRYEQLLERDLANVESGYYPHKLLFQVPVSDYIKLLPRLVRDFPRAIRRAQTRNFKDLPQDLDLAAYPAYFRRNFHWQTDGYLSRRSAELYDVGVELLFLGMADVMRRQVIPPFADRIRAQARTDRPLRVLDVGCGTGRTLRQIASAHPHVRCYGLDLSPYYVQVARQRLSDLVHAALVADNAENMPFRDGFFDVVTSVYLFHELPKNARRNVLSEIHRVLRPGGVVVIEDSLQHSDGGEVGFFLERFSQEFHEPFYRDYLGDDLSSALGECGFGVEAVEPCFVAKVVSATKPLPRGSVRA
jgi:ubiquinone/menaquinone biosynthesis C-methylase UbiE